MKTCGKCKFDWNGHCLAHDFDRHDASTKACDDFQKAEKKKADKKKTDEKEEK